MQLFYAPDITSDHYTLSEEESKHCIRVLRQGVGDTLNITDGKGSLFYCRIIDDHPKHCTVAVESVQHEFEKLSYELEMCVAPTKNIERYEWFLEKATEVGVARFTSLLAAHSERKSIKYERELKVITSAMKQSLKAYHPELRDMTPFKSLIEESFEGAKYIAHCDDARSTQGKAYLPNVLKKGENVRILIGPEGDFSPEEIEMAVKAGYREITLGHQRLRTETAALVATVMVSIGASTLE